MKGLRLQPTHQFNGLTMKVRIDLIYEGIATVFFQLFDEQVYVVRIDLIYEGIATRFRLNS